MTKLNVWFWQRMVTPHMAYLAAALARRGHNVSYVAEEEISVEREALGWQLPDIRGVALRFVSNAEAAKVLVKTASEKTIHLTQGLRSNGNISAAQNAIRARGQRHFVIMETVDQRGVAGYIKPALYFWHLHRWYSGLHGILAIGAELPTWLHQLAPKGLKVFPFAYFLPEPAQLPLKSASLPFRFLFVGALIPRKRLGFLLQTLSSLSEYRFEVEVVGNGPMFAELEAMAARILPGRVLFRGIVPISEIPAYMERVDCLVLPSSHDGWGAVVSEALMVGTPVICSAACGSRAVVQASGVGGVFETSDTVALRDLLEVALVRGRIDDSKRQSLRSWARCLGVEAGAEYLEALLLASPTEGSVPLPPWERTA